MNYPKDADPEIDLSGIAFNLANGLKWQLSTTYGLEKQNGVWALKSIPDLLKELAADPLYNLLNIG